MRELHEETGLAGCELDFLASEQVARRVHHVFRTCVLPGQQAVPDNEIADCRWFTPEEIASREIKRTIRELLRMHLDSPCSRLGDHPRAHRGARNV